MFHFRLTVAVMSTLILTKSAPSAAPAKTAAATGSAVDPAPRARLVSGRFALVLMSSFGALTSFYLLLSVTPMYAVSAGAGSSVAGLVTAALMLACVAAEFAAPALMRRYGNRVVFAFGALLLGGPALALLAPDRMYTIVAVSLVRGVGFGLNTVVTGALVATVLPRERRGEGLGLAGVVSCVPAVVALPSGVWLADNTSYAVVIVITAVAALAPLAATPWLPAVAGHDEAAAGTEQPACSPACAGAVSCARPSSSRQPPCRPAWWSPSCRSPSGRPAASQPPGCSRRRRRPRSAAGSPGGMATGTVTRAC